MRGAVTFSQSGEADLGQFKGTLEGRRLVRREGLTLASPLFGMLLKANVNLYSQGA